MPSDPRVTVAFRARPASVDWLDALAEEHRLDRSAVLRVALAIARRHETEVKTALKEQP